MIKIRTIKAAVFTFMYQFRLYKSVCEILFGDSVSRDVSY